MPEVLFNGTSGRIQGWLHKQDHDNAPVALILPPHHKYNTNLSNPLVFTLFKAFTEIGFTVLRINYRGTGKSKSIVKNSDNELNDAAMAMDWLQNQFPTVRRFWIGGFAFGSWVGMQLLMRRPEIESFVSIAPPAQLYDFSFLTPCPVPGLIIHGMNDQVVPISTVDFLMSKMRVHKGIDVQYVKLENSGHFFENDLDKIDILIKTYVTQHIKKHPKKLAV